MVQGDGGVGKGVGVKCDVFLLNPIVTSGSIAAGTSRQEDPTDRALEL